MPSANTATRAAGLPSLGVGNATSETQYTITGGTPLILYAPGTGVLNKIRRFRVTVAGRINPGTSGNWTISLYWGVSTTIGSNTKIATTGALAAGAAATNFLLEYTGYYDSTSQRMQGIQRGYVHATVVAQAIGTNAVTSLDLTGESTSAGFTVTALAGSSDAANTSVIESFELETL